MQIITGDELRRQVKELHVEDYRKRFLYQDLDRYFNTRPQRRLCVLYGLRRTGKTVMIHQKLNELNQYDKSMYILGQRGDSAGDLYQAIREHPEMQYIFVDEATRFEGFINTCSVLADHSLFAGEDRRIVLSGTDSLGFAVARGDELLDRADLIHTTYIPYVEYEYLLGKDIDDYISYGGTLTPESPFYNREDTAEYTNSAIVHNITHTLEEWDEGRHYGALSAIWGNGDLESYINRVLEYHARTFVAKVINSRFKSHDLGSARQMMQTHMGGTLQEAPFKTEELRKSIMEALEIKDEHAAPANQQSLDAVTGFLKKLDLIYQPQGTDTYIFTQPGMRYCQATALIETLQGSGAMDQLNESQKRAFTKIIDEDIRGRMLEDIITIDLSIGPTRLDGWEASKYTTVGGEYDLVLSNYREGRSAVYEIKHSSEQDDRQTKHLKSKSLAQDFVHQYGTEIVKKGVIYNGATLPEQDGIQYINISDFLKEPGKYLYKEKVQDISQIPSKSQDQRPDLKALLSKAETKVTTQKQQDIGPHKPAELTPGE